MSKMNAKRLVGNVKQEASAMVIPLRKSVEASAHVQEDVAGLIEEARSDLGRAAAAFTNTHGALCFSQNSMPGEAELGEMACDFNEAMTRALAAIRCIEDEVAARR